jgi:nucleotide-binding universal stress UspA family protein
MFAMNEPATTDDRRDPTEYTPAPVVVGVDGSVASHLALSEAAALAEALGVPLRAITVWESPDFVRWDAEDEAQRLSTAAADDFFGPDWPSWFSADVSSGEPALVLIDASNNARMLVLGTRGRGGLAGLVLGSVTTQCVRMAHCPVLVVRAPAGISTPDTLLEDERDVRH